MNINELDSFSLADAVKFHNRLNPLIWDKDENLLPLVREKLLAIADNFREFLGVGDLDVKDITLSGSNAAYSYTPHSDIDLHLVVEFPVDNPVYQELFNAKKYQYNDEHNITIGGVPVELYVQNAAESPVSQGEYSISRGEWIQVPRRKRARIDDTCVRVKVEDLDARIQSAIESGNAETMDRLWDKIKAMRQSGLAKEGEFGCENIAFKILRNKGRIKDLRTARTAAQDHQLSLQERRKKKQRVRYGYGGYWYPGFGYSGEAGEGGGDGGGESMREGHQGQPYSSEDGVAPSTQMFLNESPAESLVQQFVEATAAKLGIENLPNIILHNDDDWSESNRSFGMYVPDQHVLHVNMQNRHIMDVLRTVAHELAHCRQHELSQLPPDAGDTGSPIENEAHAVAGIIMRDFADTHPELFDVGTVNESSGYIPTEAEKNDPRFVMALTADVRPGATGLNANRMALKTDSQGRPQLLRSNGQVDSVKELAESLRSELAQLDREPRVTGKQPQPSHGDGGRREINAPLGPETPPTMPAGTVRVDVSDVYDWYKLGQHISNMKGLGQHDFGKGPPSAIISFGDEETEHKFIKDLAATGLDVTDIDPQDPKQPAGMRRSKTDPTDNVSEAGGSQYKEIEFVCVNPEFPDATDPKLQQQMYVGLTKIPGVIPLWQDQSDYSAGQASLTAIYKDRASRQQIMKLAKQLGVKIDLEQPVSDSYVDRAIQGEHEGQRGMTEADAARTAKSAIDQTEVFGVRGYRARCLEPGCEWHSRSYDRIKQAQDSAKKHAASHIKPVTEVFNTQPSNSATWARPIGQWDDMDEFNFVASNGVAYQVDFLAPVVGPDQLDPYTFFEPEEEISDQAYDSAKFVSFEQKSDEGNTGGKQGIEGTGVAAEVFGIVTNVILQYIKKAKPSMLYFQAAEPNRQRLYARMAARLAQTIGWKVKQDGPAHFAIYNPRVIKAVPLDQGVAEGATKNLDTDYFMNEGCGIFAVAMALSEPGSQIYIISNKSGESWSKSFPYEITHVFVNVPNKGQYDVHGQRSIEAMTHDFGLSKGDYGIKGPFDPKEFFTKFMGSSDNKPLYGTAKDVKELQQQIQNKQGVAEGLAESFSPDELSILNQYLDDEISWQELKRGYSDLVRKAIKHFDVVSMSGAPIEFQFYDRLVQARDEGDLGEQGVAEQDELIESLRREFELLEDEMLGEIKMSPSNLRSEAAQTGAIAGMEFEMIVPGVDSDDPEMEPDYNSDERCRSIDDAVQFFHDGDYNGRREVQRLRERMQEDFEEWLYEKIDEDWANNPEEYIYQYLVADVDPATIGEIIGEDLSDADGATKQQVARAAEIVNDNEQQPYYDDARDRHREEYNDAWDESDWLDEQDLDVMSAIESAYDITWPHWTYNNEAAVDIDSVADDFSEAVGMPVNTSQRYHGATREAGKYVVEPDGSLRGDSKDDLGLEFVSPPMPIDQMLDQLKKVREWAGRNGCYTNKTTGLHINISVPEFSNDKLDYVKLALLLGDKYVLDQFGRSSNNYTKSALGIVQDRVRAMPKTAQALLDRMRGHMDDLATKAIHSGETDKFTSINTKEGYIEFRSPGGDWLDENFDKVENTLLRFTVALKAAMDPEAYREEYLKKLYKLLEPTAQDDKGADTVRYFADYVAGKIPAAALRSFVKQAQLQRRIAKEPASGKQYWWRVYKDGRDARNTAMIEVVASSEQEAIDKAAAEFGVFSSEYKAYMDAVALRPYVETETEYEIFQVAGNRVVQTFRAADNDAALAYFDRTISAADRPYYDVRRAGTGAAAEPAAPQQTYYINNGSYNTSSILASSTEDAIRQFRNRVRNERMSSSYSLVSSDNQVLARGTDTEPSSQGGEFQFERPQTDIENRLGWPDQTADANYEVVNRNTLQPVYLFIANTDQDAARKYSQIIQAMGMPGAAENYGYRARGSRMTPVAGQGTQSGSQRPTGGGNFTGVWLILDPDGDVIHSFAGVGNVQSDANRVAMQWLRANPGAMQAGVTVVPEMR